MSADRPSPNRDGIVGVGKSVNRRERQLSKHQIFAERLANLARVTHNVKHIIHHLKGHPRGHAVRTQGSDKRLVHAQERSPQFARRRGQRTRLTLNDVKIVRFRKRYISTPLIFHLLNQADHISDMHFMLQLEVVNRLAASPGSKAWGRLGVMAQYHCQVDALFEVPPSAFTPMPKVQSAIVRLVPIQSGNRDPNQEQRLRYPSGRWAAGGPSSSSSSTPR